MHNKNKDSGSNVQLALHCAWVSAALRVLIESCNIICTVYFQAH